MASGSIGGGEELPKKNKWNENSKVYTRKVYRIPKNSNSNSSSGATTVPVLNSQLVDNKVGETSSRIGVESNGGDTNRVVNGTGINDIGNKLERVVEEVVNVDNKLEKDLTTTKNVVEDFPSCENVLEEMVSNGNVDKKVPSNGIVDKEVPSNGNVDKEVPDNGNGNRIQEVSDDVNDVEQAHNSEKNVEEVCNSEHSTEVVPNNETNIKETPLKDNNVEDVPQNEKIVEDLPQNENIVEDVPQNETIVEDEPQNDNIVEDDPQDETVVEDAPGNDVDIDEEMPQQSSSPTQPVEEANLSEPQQNPPHVETVTVSEHSSSLNRVEEILPNGHDHAANLGNGVVREEDVIEEVEEEEEEERPMVTHFDDRLNISVTAAKSVEEVRDLKRKLEGELDQVRKMARKLEVKESQVNSSVSFDSGRLNEAPPPPVRRLHIPVNGGMNNNNTSMRPTQELGSVSYSHPRSFGDLSVSVMENSYHGLGEIPHEKEKRTPKANQYYRNSDFLLGKERLPPAENNRRAKSSGGGKKHGKGEFELGLGFDKKINKKCSELLQKLRNHKHGWVFNQPVDVKRLGLHDYFDIIKHPMDLGTVKTRLTNHWYKTPREFAEDVRLTFHNAMVYNPAGQDVHIMAKELAKIFDDKWPAIEADYDRRLRYEMFRDLGTPTPTSRRLYDPPHPPIQHMPLPAPPLLRPPPTFQDTRNLDRSQSMPVRPEPRPKPTPPVRTPALKKPKARDVNKRDMTFDEKQKLSTHLQGLPSEKLDVIVQIIKKRNSALSQHDDEIEVDIDSVDTETLWELDRFVTNYKKSLSKHKRKAELAAEARARAAAAAPAQPIPETAPIAPPVVEAPRETRADEGNVANTVEPPAQQERHSDHNASDSSSSSSSSSDSGSSSSDSDSSSSSDSDEERS